MEVTYSYRVTDSDPNVSGHDETLCANMVNDGWEQWTEAIIEPNMHLTRQWRKPLAVAAMPVCPFCGAPGEKFMEADDPDPAARCSNTLCDLHSLVMPYEDWFKRRAANSTTPYADKIRVPAGLPPEWLAVLSDMNKDSAFEIMVA